jgi:hypothetical protein
MATPQQTRHGGPTKEERQRVEEEVARGRIEENQRMATARHGDTPHAPTPEDGVGVIPGEPKATAGPRPETRRQWRRAGLAFAAFALVVLALALLA